MIFSFTKSPAISNRPANTPESILRRLTKKSTFFFINQNTKTAIKARYTSGKLPHVAFVTTGLKYINELPSITVKASLYRLHLKQTNQARKINMDKDGMLMAKSPIPNNLNQSA